MLEANELHDIEFSSHAENRVSSGHTNSNNSKQSIHEDSGFNASVWKIPAASITNISVCGDPGNTLLHGCKSLLSCVLTHMLTPYDLEALAGVTIHALSISNLVNRSDNTLDPHDTSCCDNGVHSVPEDEKLSPGPV